MNMGIRRTNFARVVGMLGDATETCADVDVTIGRDHITVTKCPPSVLIALLGLVDKTGTENGIKAHDIAVADGGIRVRLI